MTTKKKALLAVGGVIAAWLLLDICYAIFFYPQGGRVEGRITHVSDYGVVRPLAGATVRVVKFDSTLALARETACESYKRVRDDAQSAFVTWSLDHLNTGGDYEQIMAIDRERTRRRHIVTAFGDSLGLAAEQAVKAAYRAATVATAQTDRDGRFSIEVPTTGVYRVVGGGWMQGAPYRWQSSGVIAGGAVVTLAFTNDRDAYRYGFCATEFSTKNSPDLE